MEIQNKEASRMFGLFKMTDHLCFVYFVINTRGAPNENRGAEALSVCRTETEER